MLRRLSSWRAGEGDNAATKTADGDGSSSDKSSKRGSRFGWKTGRSHDSRESEKAEWEEWTWETGAKDAIYGMLISFKT